MRTDSRALHLLTMVVAVFVTGLLAGQAYATLIITGSGSLAPPHVKAFSGVNGSETASFLPHGGGFSAGVRVATGDINGDGTPDIITGLGSGFAPHVKAFSGIDQSELQSFFAFAAAFTGGVHVAAGDVNRDGLADIITGAGASGATHVKVFNSGGGELHSFLAYPGVSNEVRVAAGDVNGDGFADIITGLGDGVAPHVKVFDGTNLNELHSFFAYAPAFTGGVYVAAGDINGDGFADIVTGAGGGGGTHVKVFNGMGGGELHSFFAYPGVSNEVRVGVGDVDGNGLNDIITGLGAGVPPHVKAFDGTSLREMRSFFAYSAGFNGGVFVAGIPARPIPEQSTLLMGIVGLIGVLCYAARGVKRL